MLLLDAVTCILSPLFSVSRIEEHSEVCLSAGIPGLMVCSFATLNISPLDAVEEDAVDAEVVDWHLEGGFMRETVSLWCVKAYGLRLSFMDDDDGVGEGS